jgi:uncharacterized protein (DUF885 family)
MTTHRSPIFELSEEHVLASAKFSPMGATALGIPGSDHLLDDFSIEHETEAVNYAKEVVAKANAMTPIDEIDRIAKNVLVDRLQSRISLFESGESLYRFSPISNPISAIRSIFTIMNMQAPDALANVTSRLLAIDRSIETWKSTLLEMAKRGKVVAKRQTTVVAEQARVHGDGGYEQMAQEFDPAKSHSELHVAALQAQSALMGLSRWLLDVYLPLCVEEDGIGEAAYAPWAEHFTGAKLDLRATYEWGVADLQAINDRMEKAAAKLGLAGMSLKDVADYCENAELHRIEGTDALLQKLKDFTQEAIAKLDGVYFDIDPRIKFCDAKLAPEGSAAAPYYMPPSEDLSRPGTTWYPTLGHTRFNFWHIASTWYHEAVPGHHLQCATAVIEADRLSRFQRTDAWISGYGEGWALYAERFMDELGAFDDPAIELGYLSGQALRAARIVVDIGMHCGYKDFDGKVWNADSAYNLLVERGMLAPDFAKSEIERYLGWPGQAISYKVGERVWMKVREDAKARLGAAFDIKAWHNYALKIGPMGLDMFEKEMASFK